MTPHMESRSLGTGRIRVPVVGLGTWRRLEAAAAAGRDRALLDAAIAAGVRLIDTSPMYGRAEGVTGDFVTELALRQRVFLATKVWTSGRDQGRVRCAGRACSRQATIRPPRR